MVNLLVVEHPVHVLAYYFTYMYVIMHRQGWIQEFGWRGGGGVRHEEEMKGGGGGGRLRA